MYPWGERAQSELDKIEDDQRKRDVLSKVRMGSHRAQQYGAFTVAHADPFATTQAQGPYAQGDKQERKQCGVDWRSEQGCIVGVLGERRIGLLREMLNCRLQHVVAAASIGLSV